MAPILTFATPDVPTAVTESETRTLARLADSKRVLEIGSLLGYSTIVMASVAQVVHAVDPHEGYPKDNPRPTLIPFWENLHRYEVADRMIIHVGRAEEVLPLMVRETFDFAFVDYADKTLEPTKTLIALAVDAVERGALIAVHDYGHPVWVGATLAVDWWQRHGGLRLVQVIDSLAILR